VLTPLLLAAAALAWPPRAPARPPAPGSGGSAPGSPGPGPTSLSGVPGRGRRWSWVSPKTGGGAGISVLAGVLGAAVAGVAGSVAATATAVTALFLIHSALAGRRERADLTDLIAGLRLLSRELRSGAAPPLAATHAAGAASGVAVVVLTELSSGAGARGAAGSGSSPSVGAVADIRARLMAGWELAARQGLAITPMIDAVVADASGRLAADSERAGQVAGPRVSGYVMAALPVLGLLLGSGMGADPVQVLAHTGVGNVLLLVGVTLTCAGLLWSARIVRR